MFVIITIINNDILNIFSLLLSFVSIRGSRIRVTTRSFTSLQNSYIGPTKPNYLNVDSCTKSDMNCYWLSYFIHRNPSKYGVLTLDDKSQGYTVNFMKDE